MNIEKYVGRPFLMGETDCLGLFMEFYREELGVEITNYARPKDWDSDTIDLIRLCYEREGFEMITDWKPKDLRIGDLLCMSVGTSNPNHFAVYTGEGNILHHIAGRASSHEIFRDFWRASTGFVLRHKDVPDLTPKAPDTDIRSLLHARSLQA